LSLGNASEGNNFNDFTVFFRLCYSIPSEFFFLGGGNFEFLGVNFPQRCLE